MAGLPTRDRMNAQPVWIAPNPTPGLLFHTGTAGSYLIMTGPGWVTGIAVNTVVTNGTLTVYDGIDATGTVMAVMDVSRQAPSPGGTAPWPFQTGLFLVLNNNADITLVAHGA